MSKYTYQKYQYDKFYGKQLLMVFNASGNSYRVKEFYLARNEEGMLGFIGEGITWFLNYITESGAGCFNPISEDKLMWSNYHNAYILKSEEEHFNFPVVLKEFYRLENGIKTVGAFYDKQIEKHHFAKTV